MKLTMNATVLKQPRVLPKRKEQAGDNAERHDLGEWRKELRQIAGRDE